VAPTNTVTNTQGPVTNTNGGNTQTNAGNNASQTTSYTENYERAPVSTAYATPLNFSSDTCYASISAGGQGITFGLSAAVPFKDEACEARANARTLQLLGEREAAILYLAAKNKDMNDAITAARKRQAAAVSAK